MVANMGQSYLQVGEVMTRRPVVIESGKTVTDAAIKMRKFDVSSLVVMKQNKVAGIVTMDDMVYKVTAEKKRSSESIIDDIMSTDVVSLEPGADLQEALIIMNENEIKQLPIIEGGKLVGFLTLKDVMRIEPALMDLVVDRVRNQEEQRRKIITRIASQEPAEDDDLFN